MIVECADAPIKQTDKEFCYDINANFDGLLNNRTYKVVFKAETQNPINGEGMKLEGSGTFFTQYEEMKLNQKPKVTQLDEKGGVKIDFSSLVTNNGTLDGDYSFINNFIFYENEALSLPAKTTLTYKDSVIPSMGSINFTIKLDLQFDGLICSSIDLKYKFGYSSQNRKFYYTINDFTIYSEVIRITENPFLVILLSDHFIIKQYNIYNYLDNIKNFNLDDLQTFPLDFMVQENK